MKLKDFVKQAVEDIVMAVVEARDSLATTGADICPPLKTDLETSLRMVKRFLTEDFPFGSLNSI